MSVDEGRERTKASKKELEELTQKHLSKWSGVWNSILQDRRREGLTDSPSELEVKIKRKMLELINEEEVLKDLYVKAAEAAKQRQKELNDKAAMLMEQIQKDRNLMRGWKIA